jgi:hypothetical protein
MSPVDSRTVSLTHEINEQHMSCGWPCTRSRYHMVWERESLNRTLVVLKTHCLLPGAGQSGRSHELDCWVRWYNGDVIFSLFNINPHEFCPTIYIWLAPTSNFHEMLPEGCSVSISHAIREVVTLKTLSCYCADSTTQAFNYCADLAECKVPMNYILV